MPRTSGATAVIKIRQTYNRFGKPYCSIGIPSQVLQWLGWQPGEFMMVYVTKDKGMKVVPVTAGVGDDFDKDAIPATESMRGPRPGSLHEAEVRADASLDEMLQELERVVEAKKQGSGQPEKESSATRRRTPPQRGQHRKRRR